jgi:hypothetical protein
MLTFAMTFAIWANWSWAEEPTTAADTSADLDAELLEDLGADLFDEPADLPKSATPRAPQDASQGEGNFSDLDQDLLDSLGEDLDPSTGEDIGQSTLADDPQAPLERIGLRMRSAQKLLTNKDASGRAPQLQGRIVQDLDELIKKVQRQKRQAQQEGKPSPGSQRSDAQPQGNQPGEAMGEGQEPAPDSSDQLRNTGEGGQPIDRQAMQEVLKRQWGHLPGRQREQMLQSWFDEFLPQYELEIEQYFRRLAEDPDP